MNDSEYKVLPCGLYRGEWRVERIDMKTGDCFVTLFSGQDAEARAHEYAAFKNGAAIDAQKGGGE